MYDTSATQPQEKKDIKTMLITSTLVHCNHTSIVTCPLQQLGVGGRDSIATWILFFGCAVAVLRLTRVNQTQQ
jgi:hypothetical protein